MTNYALYFNNKTDNIEVYPLLEDHNLSKKEIERYLEENEDVEKWIVYDHMPDDDDLESFEEFINAESDDE